MFRTLRLAPLSLLMLMPALVLAVPPALEAFNRRLQALEDQITLLNDRIATESQKQNETLQHTQQLERQSLSLSRWPTALATLTGMGQKHDPAQLLAHLRSQTIQRLQQQQQKLQTLVGLRQQAGREADQLEDLQKQFLHDTRKLSAEDKIALATAETTAHNLALDIQSALVEPLKSVATPATLEESLPAPAATAATRLPINGRPRATTTGLLFDAAPGSAVTAATGGRVLYAGPFRQFGGLVIVAVAPRTQHIYAGLGTLTVAAGQTIAAGQPLGALPDRPGARLYWEGRKNGKPLPAGKLLRP